MSTVMETMRDPDYHDVNVASDVARIHAVRISTNGSGRVTCVVRVFGKPEAEADGNLAKVFREYATKAAIRILGVEDFAGPLDATRAGYTPVLSNALKDLGLSLMGVDVPPARDRMIQVQRMAMQWEAEHIATLQAIRPQLHLLCASTPSEQSRALVELRQAWWTGASGLADTAVRVLALAAAAGVELGPSEESVLRAHSIGKGLDQAAGNRELSELRERIRRTASKRRIVAAYADGKRDVWGWLESTGLHVDGAVDVTRIHSLGGFDRGLLATSDAMGKHIANSRLQIDQMFDLTRVLGIDLGPYATWRRYCHHIQMLAHVGEFGAGNMAEASQVVVNRSLDRLERSIFNSPRERDLARAQRTAYCLERLVRLQLSPELADEILANLSTHCAAEILRCVRTHGGTLPNSLDQRVVDLDKRRVELLSFYVEARLRATNMALETVRKMRAAGEDRAFLMCLGFHVDTIMKVLEGANVGCVVIHPRFEL